MSLLPKFGLCERSEPLPAHVDVTHGGAARFVIGVRLIVRRRRGEGGTDSAGFRRRPLRRPL
eukprot:1605444-Pyramimonas_sp.AAC.1